MATAPCVVFCAEDDFREEKTAFGSVRLWKITHREQFERAVQALAYRCEPREIPKAVGFLRYTQNKENYTDGLILLSTGYYSGLSP